MQVRASIPYHNIVARGKKERDMQYSAFTESFY